ncbi:MAG: hypothetical protein IJV68_07025, partial [Clostridia bacterium]|nr:hypothetical protein [Clostridia bacterium]
YGFANYDVYVNDGKEIEPIKIIGGEKDTVNAAYDKYETLVKKGEKNNITYELVINENINAPLKKGDVLGKVIYKSNGEVIGENNIYSTEELGKITFLSYILRIIKNLF